jgi:hypothetical protein
VGIAKTEAELNVAISWAIKVVEYDIGYSTRPRLQFDRFGQPAIAYYSTFQQGIRFASRTAAGDWIKSTVVSGLAGEAFCSFKFAPTRRLGRHWFGGQPALSYSRSNTMNFAQFSGSIPWDTVEFADYPADPEVGLEGSLAFDPIHLRPSVSVALGTKGVRFFQLQQLANSSVWIDVAADTTSGAGYPNSLDFDPSGQPCIAYGVDGANVIKAAFFNGASWNIVTVGPGDVDSCSLVLGTQPSLIYSTYGSGNIFLATAQVPRIPWNFAWNVQTPIAEPADSQSLAVPPSGGIAISYHAVDSASIKYTVYNGNTWTTYLVERSGKDQTGHIIGDFTLTSLAFNPITNLPAIAYYEQASAAIRYAEASP